MAPEFHSFCLRCSTAHWRASKFSDVADCCPGGSLENGLPDVAFVFENFLHLDDLIEFLNSTTDTPAALRAVGAQLAEWEDLAIEVAVIVLPRWIVVPDSEGYLGIRRKTNTDVYDSYTETVVFRGAVPVLEAVERGIPGAPVRTLDTGDFAREFASYSSGHEIQLWDCWVDETGLHIRITTSDGGSLTLWESLNIGPRQHVWPLTIDVHTLEVEVGDYLELS
jgi:hypothetical protein